MKLDDFGEGMKVRLPGGEIGEVQHVDYNEGMVYVGVPVLAGTSVIDIDPDEPGLEIVGTRHEQP